MPETSNAGRQVAPAQLAERLARPVRHPMISAAQAAVRAREILEYPAGDPQNGWELEEFPQGWLVHWRGWKGQPGQFSIVIEREAGLVRYFTTFIPPQAITAGYEAVRELSQAPAGRSLFGCPGHGRQAEWRRAERRRCRAVRQRRVRLPARGLPAGPRR